MSFWRRLIGFLRADARNRKKFEVSGELLQALRVIAEQEGRSEHEVVVDLISSGYNQQYVAWELVQSWQTLTERERQVARLIWMGYTNGEIAAALYISTDTVKTHVRNILRKFGVRNRVQLRQMLADWQLEEPSYPDNDLPAN